MKIHSIFRETLVTLCCACFLGCLLTVSAASGDWPTYRGDNARSGIQEHTVQPPLDLAWVFKPKQPPRPAWQGEAKWDGWNKVYDLKNRQDFDHAFHVVGAGDAVYFGSSSEDKVFCLNADDGKVRWIHYTEGPVRLAPTLHDGFLYVGSDDGFIYKLNASNGELIWKVRPGPRDYRIPGNGRLISAWPARTGVVIQDGVAYAGVGMFPSEGVFVCSLDIETGDVLWKTEQTDLPAQGYLVSSSSRLYVPTGRNNPVVLNIADGKRERVLEGQGGSYALLTDDALVFGPGKTGELRLVESGSKDQLATFQGNHMIVYRGRSYLHSDTDLQAIDRHRYMDLATKRRDLYQFRNQLNDRLKKLQADKDTDHESDMESIRKDLVSLARDLDGITEEMKECMLWKQHCDFPFSLVLSGDVLFTGGRNRVGAFDAQAGKLLWSGAVEGRALGLASIQGHLYVSTDLGLVYAFKAVPQQAAAR